MLFLCLVLQFFTLVSSEVMSIDSPENLRLLRDFRKWILRTYGMSEEQLRTMPEELWRMQPEVPPNVPFPCNVTGGRSPEVPDSVHRLRPGDIDVIAALGDSLTAGNGIFATTIPQIVIENRGVAAAIGGQRTWRRYLTIPNILKEFNPNLIGYSLGDSFIYNPGSQLNVAEGAAMIRDMPFMAKYLINRMKKDPRIDIEKHWKLIYIFIGHNDICSDSCYLPSISRSWINHRKHLIETLRILKDNLPRTIVSINVMANPMGVTDKISDQVPMTCYIMQRIECSCLIGTRFRHRRADVVDAMDRVMEVQVEVTKYPEFNSKDFTVISSPVAARSITPRNKDGSADLSYYTIDCFHASQKTNALYANGLWNNLLEPVNNKSVIWSPLFERFLCPTPKMPYIATRENS